MSADLDGPWPLSALLTERIGSGPRSADDLTYEQAREGAARLLAGTPDRATAAAFLLANRWKVTTPEELAGFVDAMRSRSVRVAEPDVDPVDCGANYDGKRETALLGVAGGLVAAAAGTPVVVHAGPTLPATEGVTYRDVLATLGVPTDLAPGESAAMVDDVGFGFYHQSSCNPLVDDRRGLRRAVAVRTSLNTAETLANPAGARAHLGSFYHRSYAERVIDGVERSRTLDVERVVMVGGLEGYDDPRSDAAPIHERTADGSVATLAPETELSFSRGDLAVDDVRVDSAELTRAVLAGRRDGPVADAVALTAAHRIYAGGDARTVGEAVERARSVLSAGDAVHRLNRLREFRPDEASASD